MRKTWLLIFLIIIMLNSLIKAQNSNGLLEIDDLGQEPLDNMLGRMDYFHSELFKRPTSIGLIKISGGAKNSMANPYIRGAMLQAYLINDRKLEPNRLIVQNCNVSEPVIRIQLFSILNENAIEKCDENLIVPKETSLFNIKHYENPYIQFEGCCDISDLGETSKAAQKFLAQLLSHAPEGKIYLIVYLGTNVYTDSKQNKKGEWKDIEIRKLDKSNLAEKMLRQAENEIIKNGVNSSRIIKINGGRVDSTRRLEFWFMPKGGTTPQPKPDYFPNKNIN